MSTLTSGMIKAVVFDMGGVLIPDAHSPMLYKLVLENGMEYPGSDFKKLFEASRAAWKLIEVGKISEEEFWTMILKSSCLLKRETPESLGNRLRDERLFPFYSMFGIAAEMKTRGVVLGILSNHCREWFNYAWSNLHMDFLFSREMAVVSYEVGVPKPDPKIYKRLEFLLLGKDIKVSETMFLDDKEENVKAAQDNGFQAMLFDSRKDDFSVLRYALGLPI